MHGPLTRYVKLWVAHATEMPGTFSRHRLQTKPLVSDSGMHHGTCVTHVPWCMSGSLTRSGGENVPGILGACATRNLMYLARGPCTCPSHCHHCTCRWPRWLHTIILFSAVATAYRCLSNNILGDASVTGCVGSCQMVTSGLSSDEYYVKNYISISASYDIFVKITLPYQNGRRDFAKLFLIRQLLK